MKKLLATAIIIVFLLNLMSFFDAVNAEITVSGPISVDTVWSRGNTYVLRGTIEIPSGVTLIIEPGATVHLASYNIQVNGVLKAQGTNTEPVEILGSGSSYGAWINCIQFKETSTSWSDFSASGCIIQNVRIQSGCIVIEKCSPKISYNNLNQTVITVSDGSPLVENNEIYGPVLGHGITVESGSATVSGNYLHDSSGILAKGNAYVTNNRVDNCWDGIRTSGQTTVKGNTVSRCKGGGTGILAEGSGAVITQNYVYNNYYGITGVGTIESNTVIGNTVGIQIFQVEESTSIHHNSICNNSQYDFMMSCGTDLDLANNYWGTTNNEVIGQKILDYSDDFSKGKVTYSPFLTQPSASAPSVPGVVSEGAPFDLFTSFDYEIEVLILKVAQIVAAALVIGWIGVLSVMIVKRRKRKRA